MESQRLPSPPIDGELELSSLDGFNVAPRRERELCVCELTVVSSSGACRSPPLHERAERAIPEGREGHAIERGVGIWIRSASSLFPRFFDLDRSFDLSLPPDLFHLSPARPRLSQNPLLGAGPALPFLLCLSDPLL